MFGKSLITRIVIITCGIVACIMFTGGLFMMKVEIKLVDEFNEKYLSKINRTISDREKAEKITLQQNIKFNTEILRAFAGPFLYNLENEYLMRALDVYMNSPEILAVKVLNEFERPFGAAWKNPEIQVGEALPEDLDLDDSKSILMDYMHQGNKIGSFQVFYTDAPLVQKISEVKESAAKEAKQYKAASKIRLNGVLLSQGFGGLMIVIILLVSLIFTIRALVLKPIRYVSNIANKIAAYDLSIHIIKDRKDEIGEMLLALDLMLNEIKQIVQAVKTKGKDLTIASEDMSMTADRLFNTSDEITKQTNDVSDISTHISTSINSIVSTANDMSKNVKTISQTSEQMSDNITTVASSIEEMSASMNEVGQNAKIGAQIAIKAVSMASKAGHTMALLGEAANEIGGVTKVIMRIGDKTNLLALNAAIEAASAGEAGKGFAVVANAIQKFADQSSQAAEDIATRISGVQENISEAVQVIADVSAIIEDVNISSETISVSVEEQTKAADDIASNAVQADIRAKDIANAMEALVKKSHNIASNISESARGSNEITENLKRVSRSIHTTHSSIEQVNLSIKQLEQLTGELYGLVSKFKT